MHIFLPCIIHKRLNMLVYNLTISICFQIHWSSVLLSLVSYILLLIVILLFVVFLVGVAIKKLSNINSSPEVVEHTNVNAHCTATEADFCLNENKQCTDLCIWSGKKICRIRYGSSKYSVERSNYIEPLRNHHVQHFTPESSHLSHITCMLNKTT